jgi:single-strand DNA-binding protein
LTKGTRVIVTGRLKTNSYTTKEGEKRTELQLEVEDIGPALRYATAKVTRQAPAAGGAANSAPQQSSANSQEDPWASPAAGGWNGANEEPPF